jgi:hypothetical protein
LLLNGKALGGLQEQAMEFLADLAHLASIDLVQRGVSFRKKLLEEDPLVFYARYLEFLAKRIQQKPRQVLLSDVLRSGERRAKYGKSIDAMLGAAERGEDLSRFQTKDIEHFTKPDLLLNDWGIHHLHLGAPKTAGHRSNRTDELLFVFLTDATEICFVDVLDHQSFTEVELLETINRNWPHLLADFHISHAKNLQPKLTAEERQSLRQAGIVTFVELASGQIFAPPGGGVTTARSNINCMRRAQATARTLVEAEKVVQANDDRIRAALEMGAQEEMRLIVYGGSFLVVGSPDGRNGVQIPIRGVAA